MHWPISNSDNQLINDRHVEYIEIRADKLGYVPIESLRQYFHASTIFAYRENQECPQLSKAERKTLLYKASLEYDFVELIWEYDQELIPLIPPHKRILSIYTKDISFHSLYEQCKQMLDTEAHFYKCVVETERAKTGVELLTLLHTFQHSALIGYTIGQYTAWTHLLGALLGSPLLFGCVGEASETKEGFTLAQLLKDYTLSSLRGKKHIYGIVGNQVKQSLSPRLHNAHYELANWEGIYIPFQIEQFADFWENVVQVDAMKEMGFSFEGFTVAAPFKSEVLKWVKEIENPLIHFTQAANIILRTSAHWVADTSDSVGILKALTKRGIETEGLCVGVIGCGGAGTSIALALNEKGANVYLINRDEEKGRTIAQAFGIPFIPLSQIRIDAFELLVNATPVGKYTEQMIVEPSRLPPHAIVADLVYRKNPTAFIRKAQSLGLDTIEGKEILIGQVAKQLHCMTGLQLMETYALQLIHQPVCVD